MKSSQGSSFYDKTLSSKPIREPWDNDLVRIFDEKSFGTPSLQFLHEVMAELSIIHPRYEFTASYIQRRYLRVRFLYP